VIGYCLILPNLVGEVDSIEGYRDPKHHRFARSGGAG
jgi:hypothetical protein